MSNNRRDYQKSSTNNQRINNKDEDYHRINDRSNEEYHSQTILNSDTKVYVGNIPTDNITDRELLQFFKPFGNISDIRVYQGYLFVQYHQIEDAKKLIEQGQNSLIFKGNKLDILPSMDVNLNNKSFYNDNSYKDSKRYSHDHFYDDQYSNNYQPPRKRSTHQHHIDQQQPNIFNYHHDSNLIERVDDNNIDLSRNNSYNLSESTNNLLNDKNESFYKILNGSNNSKDLIDCRIIIVNYRQRGYAEDISSYLRSNGLITSIILLREDYTLIEAIEDSKMNHCLYAIIIMPMHEQRHKASFHILYQQIEEHRNLILEDGYDLILKHFHNYKQHIQNEELNKYNKKEYIYKNSSIKSNDKLPLSILLCLLADGKQLTLEEIDRVLVYLLEKKSNMLTLPKGTLPPLPAQYANINIEDQTKSISRINNNYLNDDISSTIVEQIRQIISSNLISNQNNKLEEDQNTSLYSYSKLNKNSNDIISSSFNYPSTNENCFFPSTSSSSLNQSRTTNNSEYFFSSNVLNKNVYKTLPNTDAIDTNKTIFQTYSQLNTQPTSINNQQTQK